MAVIRQDLRMTTIQFKQLQALESLNSYMERSVDLLGDIESKFSEKIYQQTAQLLTGLSHEMTPIDRSLRSIDHNFKNFLKTEFAYSDDILNQIETTRSNVSDSINTFSEEVLDQLEDIRDNQENPPDPPEPPDPGEGLELLETINSTIKSVGKQLLDSLARSANTWSAYYNDTIKYTGANQAESQQFRSDLVRIVDDLNSEVSVLGDLGSKIDPQQIMNSMMTIADSASISDVDTLKAVMRPMILAQETTNMNMVEFAKFGSRMYNLYNFGSKDMEDMVDSIRNLSKDRNVDENAILNYANALSAYIGDAANGDTELAKQLMNAALANQASLQASGLDSSTYEQYAILARQAKEDENGDFNAEARKQLQLALGGFAQEFIDNVGTLNDNSADVWLKALNALYENKNLRDIGNFGSIGSYEDSIIAHQILNGTYTPTDELLESVETGASAVETLEDKFVNIGDQINNNLNTISKSVASLQEFLGIGFDEVVTVLGTLLGIKGIQGLLGGSGGVASAAAAGGKGLLGLLMTSGPAIGIAAGVAGLAVTAAGILNSYEKVNQDKIRAAGDLAKGAATEDTEFYWQSSMKDGQVSWDYVSVDTSGFDTKQLEDFHKKQEENQKAYSEYLTSREGLSGWGKVWDVLTSHPATGNVGAHVSSQLEHQKLLEDLASYNKNPTYMDMMNYYLSSGMLDYSKNDMLKGFIDHIDEYLAYYNEGKVAEVGKSGKPGTTADKVASYDVGTNYVDRDQLAYIHEGEEIVPKKYNPSANTEVLRELIERQDDSEELSEISDLLSDIKEFLSYWKKDSEKKSTINTLKTTTTLSSNKYKKLRA